jgi:uncharacterized membrane-anchored protein
MSARMARRLIAALLSGMMLVLAQPLAAEDSSATPESEPALTPAQQAARGAWQAAAAAMIRGPSMVPIRDQANLALPEGFSFVPREPASNLMRLMGNTTGDEFVGLIFPQGESKNWLVSVDYESSGYVKDDEARDWDAKKLLQDLKDGTEAANEERSKRGIPAIMVTRWVEVPAYDSSTHRLVWSAEVKQKDGSDQDPGINYNTYVLGREGYISLNLITSQSSVEEDKPAARELLAAVNFNEGKRYTDFNSSTDKVAAYGLAALIAGVAAKKLGLLALAGAFILKFAKVIGLAVAAAGGGVWKWMKGRGNKDPGTSA